MSHFSVLVASRSVGEVESLLAPYQEGGVDRCDFAEFMDETEVIEDEYKAVESEGEYEDIDDFASNYYGYDKINGRYGYWFNPNAKWDWYQFGGRFGVLPLKNGDTGNSVPKSEVDFSLDQEQYERSLRFWEIIVEGHKPTTEEEEDMIAWNMYKREYFTERYTSKESYAEAMASFNTYAYVSPDGEWHAKGEMGWFGFSDEDSNKSISHELNFYDRYLAELDDDIILTLVDCHI